MSNSIASAFKKADVKGLASKIATIQDLGYFSGSSSGISSTKSSYASSKTSKEDDKRAEANEDKKRIAKKSWQKISDNRRNRKAQIQLCLATLNSLLASDFQIINYQVENMVYYFTLGLSKKIDLFGSSFFTKFSFSNSLFSSYEPPVTTLDDKLSGYKAMFYINHNISKKFYIHSLVKYHSMKSSSDLSSLRIGLGIGYILF